MTAENVKGLIWLWKNCQYHIQKNRKIEKVIYNQENHNYSSQLNIFSPDFMQQFNHFNEVIEANTTDVI